MEKRYTCVGWSEYFASVRRVKRGCCTRQKYYSISYFFSIFSSFSRFLAKVTLFIRITVVFHLAIQQRPKTDIDIESVPVLICRDIKMISCQVNVVPEISKIKTV